MYFASNDNYVFAISLGCGIDSIGSFNLFGVRPALYLSSNVMIVAGDGREENPFVLSV